MLRFYSAKRIERVKNSRIIPVTHEASDAVHNEQIDANSAQDIERKFGVPLDCVHPDLLQFDLEVILGKGSFAKVALARHKVSNRLHAIKIMSKDHLVNHQQIKSVIQERKLMASNTHPFVIRLYSAFQTAKKFFMVLEFCGGGELYFHMNKAGKFPVQSAKFYCSSLALALLFLHGRGVLFRDLKAENVLMVDTGYIKLSDFGLATSGIHEWNRGAKTMCGTPHYMAPETFLTDNYGFSCDWWSLGVLTYEMIGGIPPFRGKTAKAIYRSVIENKLVLLSSWPMDVKHFFAHVLAKNPPNRLGFDGEGNIVRHKFFRTIDLDCLLRMTLEAPYRPEVTDVNAIIDKHDTYASGSQKGEGRGEEDDVIAPAREARPLPSLSTYSPVTVSPKRRTNALAACGAMSVDNLELVHPNSTKNSAASSSVLSSKFDSYMSSLNVDPKKFEALNVEHAFTSIYASDIISGRANGDGDSAEQLGDGKNGLLDTNGDEGGKKGCVEKRDADGLYRQRQHIDNFDLGYRCSHPSASFKR